tara:strand:- start:3948 stop:4394 length:447 start_codon:yes stop_codon:yes gene_type:complete
MADLVVTHTETVTLNGTAQGSSNSFTISSIDQVFKRIVTVAANNDATVLVFNSDVHGAAGAIDVEDAKYIRITNLDSTNSVNLGVVGASDNFQVVLAAKQSFVMGSPDDSMLGEEDTTPAFSSFEDVASVICDSGTNNVNLEVFVASV